MFCDDAFCLIYVVFTNTGDGPLNLNYPTGDAPMVSVRFQGNPDGALCWPYSLFREIFHAIWVVWGNAKFGAKFGALSQNLGISWSSRAVFTQNLSFFGKFWLSFVKILPTREFFGQEMQNLGRNLGNI